MEEADAAKEWFVTHEGKQFGPVSIKDLKFEIERGELNPRLDMIWKNGMEDWIPAGELSGLFEKNAEAGAAETAKEASDNFTGYIPEESEEQRERVKGNWLGAGRGAFIFVCYILPFILGILIGLGASFLQGKVDANLLGIVSFGLLLLPAILAIAVTLKRFQNLGMTRWWFLGLLVPLLNIWVYYRILACPPGYAEHKKLDAIGWVLAILYWLLTLLSIAAVAGMFYIMINDPEAFEKLSSENGANFSEFMEKAADLHENIAKPSEGGEPSAEPEPEQY